MPHPRVSPNSPMSQRPKMLNLFLWTHLSQISLTRRFKANDLLDCVNWAKDRQMLDEEVDPLLCNDNYTAEDLVPDDIFKLIDITLSHQQV